MVGRSNPLYRRKSVSLKDIAQQPLVLPTIGGTRRIMERISGLIAEPQYHNGIDEHSDDQEGSLLLDLACLSSVQVLLATTFAEKKVKLLEIEDLAV